MTKKVIYLSGPITGVDEYWLAFQELADYIDGTGRIALNPSALPEGMDRWKYIRIDLAMIDAADAVVLAANWYDSPGCRLEEAYARETGKPICYDLNELDLFLDSLEVTI